MSLGTIRVSVAPRASYPGIRDQVAESPCDIRDQITIRRRSARPILNCIKHSGAAHIADLTHIKISAYYEIN